MNLFSEVNLPDMKNPEVVKPEPRPREAEKSDLGKEADRPKREFLRRLDKLARILALAGTLSGLAPGAAASERRGGASVSEQYQQQIEKVERLDQKERAIESRLGRNYDPVAKHFRRQLEEELSQAKQTGKTELRDVAGQPWDTAEAEKEPLTETSDIECKDGKLSKETLKKILEETYPKGFAAEFDYVGKERNKLDPEAEKQAVEQSKKFYNLSGEDLTSVVRTLTPEREKAKMFFSSGTRGKSAREIVEYDIGHEIMHPKGVNPERNMTAEEWANLQLSLLERLNSPDRYKSTYVEGIGGDTHGKNYLKVNEYYAEIGGQYFRDASQLHKKDFDIIDSRVRKSDLGFNWKDAKQRRDLLIQQSLLDHAFKR